LVRQWNESFKMKVGLFHWILLRLVWNT
jgi:hypothetical protein